MSKCTPASVIASLHCISICFSIIQHLSCMKSVRFLALLCLNRKFSVFQRRARSPPALFPCSGSLLRTDTHKYIFGIGSLLAAYTCMHVRISVEKVYISLYLCEYEKRNIDSFELSILLLVPQNTALVAHVKLHNFTVLNTFDFILSGESARWCASSWDHKIWLLKLCQTMKLPTTPFTYASIIITGFVR